MGLLGRPIVVPFIGSLFSCYAPEVRDCTIACASEADCAEAQTCNPDGYCVSLAETRCMSTTSQPGATPDGGTLVTTGDAGVPDAAPAAPDAPTHGLVTLTIEGQGFVQLEGVGTCAATCEYSVPLAISVTMHAYPDDDFYFDRWTTNACADVGDSTCTFVPALTLQLGAKFRKDH